MTVAAELVVTVKKSERFVRRLFQAAVEIINKKSPKASFIDFHGCGSFHKLPLPPAFFLFWFFFLSLCLHREVVENISRQDRL